jgi:predicted dehydrogenase
MNDMSVSKDMTLGTARPRLGFLGTGWIGRHRMQAILESGAADAVAIADASPEMLEEAAKAAPQARRVADLDALLAEDLDGIVIATPSAQHAEQTIRALNAGVAVFCQKPLGRDAGEVKTVVEAARAADRLLGVDFSYRHTAGIQRIRELVRAGELGRLFAVDLTFHNAYGPDKPWFYDKAQSGGGCVMDLGVHLVDLALWILDFPKIARIDSHLTAGGRPLAPESSEVEDHAVATLVMESGLVVRLACSWRLQAGCDAVMEASFYGTGGGASMRNVDGSFYDFLTERYRGTARERLAGPPEEWGGRAAVAWAEQLRRGKGFDPTCLSFLAVASAMDGIYRGEVLAG